MKTFFDNFFTNIRSILALLIIVLGFGFLYAILFKQIPGNNSHVIEISSGIILGVVVSVGGYYFGSSKDTSDKAKTDQANLLNGK